MSLFTLVKHGIYILVEFPEVFDRNAVKEFEQVSAQWLIEGTSCVVFNFINCVRFKSDGFPCVTRYKMALKKAGISFFSINVSRDVKASLIHGGVEGVFSIRDTFQQIQEQIGFKTNKKNILDAEILNVILEGVNASFTPVFSHQAIRGKPFVKNGALTPGLGVLSVLSLIESDLFGAVRFYFTEGFLQELNKVKYKQDVRGISQKAVDDIETFSASYFDNIQHGMAAKNIQLQGTIPSVVIGILSQLVPSAKEVTLVLPFKSQYGDFWVEIAKV